MWMSRLQPRQRPIAKESDVTSTPFTLPPGLCICRDPNCKISYGLCHCGCKEKTSIAPQSATEKGWIRGMPTRFKPGHNGTIHPAFIGPREGRQQTRYRNKMKQLGLCTKCGQSPASDGNLMCALCSEKARIRVRLWQLEHGRNRKKSQRYCVICQVPVVSNRVLCDEHRYQTCKVCGNSFDASPGRGKLATKAKYCSVKCHGDSKKGIYPAHLVGKNLGGLGITGPLHNGWKGGITPLGTKARNTLEMRRWREKVYQRDNWTCQDCGKRGGVIHAHHIKFYAEYPELGCDVDNGVTLCADCHSLRHGRLIPTKRFYGKENTQQRSLFNRREV